MSTDAEPDYGVVMAEAKRLLGCPTDTALAKKLGVSTGGLANYKKRQSVPWAKLIRVFRSHGMSIESLIFDEQSDTQDATHVPAEEPQVRAAPDVGIYAVTSRERPGGPADQAAVGEATAVVVAVSQDLAGLVRWLSAWWSGASAEERNKLLLFLIEMGVTRGDERARW